MKYVKVFSHHKLIKSSKKSKIKNLMKKEQWKNNILERCTKWIGNGHEIHHLQSLN